MKLRLLVTALVLFPLWHSAGWAGSYERIARCFEEDTTVPFENAGCVLGRPKTVHPSCNGCMNEPGDPECCRVTPFGITHPVGYTGNESVLEVRICIADGSMALEPAVERAIAIWEALAPTTQNCHGCGSTGEPEGTLWEESAPTVGSYFADLTVLHELGHCALALDHVDRLWDEDDDGDFEETSFTRSANALHAPGGLDDGGDEIRGSKDDYHTAPQGGLPADSVSWFRKSDNDPFVVDATVIDSDTYSRSRSMLPAGHDWGASGNRRVSDDPIAGLGYTNTQAVMYSRGIRGHYYSGLSADDVNMVKMGMTGEDLLAGVPGIDDDYTIDLIYVGECGAPSTHDIKVYLGELDAGVLGGCTLHAVDYSFPPNNPLLARHFSLVQDIASTPFEVILNDEIPWYFDDPTTLVFLDGFESGDTSAWDDVVP